MLDDGLGFDTDISSLNLGHTLFVILGKVLNLPGSHFPHPSNGDDYNNHHIS